MTCRFNDLMCIYVGLRVFYGLYKYRLAATIPLLPE